MSTAERILAITILILGAVGIATLAASCSAGSTTSSQPELTNQRTVYFGGYPIYFGCDGSTGVYRGGNTWDLAVAIDHSACR